MIKGLDVIQDIFSSSAFSDNFASGLLLMQALMSVSVM